MSSSAFEPPAALILAHPGHELLLHRFLEQVRPVVFVLTDGSGGDRQDRRAFSRQVIASAGAEVGAVFGPHSDRTWYSAILAGDPGPFQKAQRIIADVCAARGARLLVADPVELFNPMHDLCAALAAAVADEVAGGLGERPAVFDYPLDAAWAGDRNGLEFALDAPALQRKIAAARSYAPLSAEVNARVGLASLATERLRRTDGLELWPERPAQEPFYERFGRRRVSQGAYHDLITYEAHVRPIAVALGAARRLEGDPECGRPPSSPPVTSAPISEIA